LKVREIDDFAKIIMLQLQNKMELGIIVLITPNFNIPPHLHHGVNHQHNIPNDTEHKHYALAPNVTSTTSITALISFSP